MNSRYTIKRIIITTIFSLLVAFIVYLSATNSNKDDHDKSSKNTITIAFDSKITTGDPRLIGSDANSQYLENLRFLSLMGYDEHGSLINVLANNVKSLSNKSWQIFLKKGVNFNNGREIDAFDVEATYDHIINTPEGFPPSPRKAAFSNVLTFKAKDKDTLQISLKEPDASFLNNLIIGILPKEAIITQPNEINNKGFESGPFILKSTGASDWTLVKNPNYNYSSLAQIEQLIFKIIPDSGTRYAALARGDIDIAQNAIDPDKVSLIQKTKNSKFEVLSAPKLATTYLAFNFRDPNFNILKIRQAIAYAIDRQSLLQFRLQGQGLIATGMFPNNNFYYDSSIPEIAYNPQRAKTLLKETSVKEPLEFIIKVSNNNKSTVEVAKAIAANLKDVGFSPTVEMLENNVFLEQIKKGTAKVWISQWVGFKDPDHLRFVFSSNMIPPDGGNRGAYSNPSIDNLLQEGREEMDPKKRKMIYDQAQKLLAGDLPYVYLWHNLNIAIVSKRVKGFKLYADGRYWSLATVTKN